MGSSLPRPWGGHSGSYLSHAVQKTKQQLVMMMMRECCQVWELLSTKDGSPTVTSSSTAGARAERLIPNQKAQVLTQELPGDSWEQLLPCMGLQGGKARAWGLFSGGVAEPASSLQLQAPPPSGDMGGSGGGC